MLYANALSFLFLGWLWTGAYQAARSGWRFDLISFVLGFVAALLLVVLIYRLRDHFAQVWEQAQESVNQFRRRLTADMATRYSISAIETAQTMHLLGAMASLDQIYVEAQVYTPLNLTKDGSAPLILKPWQAVQANSRLVIIGQPGSGRTTLLNHLLLLQASRLSAAGEGERVPVYILLPSLVNEVDVPDKMGGTPAERLVQEAVASLSQIVATGVARWLGGQVEAGNALILLDGWDQVPAAKRPAVTAWIQALAKAYPDNRLVLAAGERGYAPLIEAGFIPLRPVPWTRRQLAELTVRWANAQPSKGEKSKARPHITYRLTLLTPFWATVELALQLNGGQASSVPTNKMTQLLGLLFPPPPINDQGKTAWPIGAGYHALGQMAFAAIVQEQPLVERGEIQSRVTEALPPPQFALDKDEEDVPREAAKKAREESEERTLQVVDCCRALTASGGPLRAWSNRCYIFAHPLITAYLAARHLAAGHNPEGVATIVAHVDNPAWLDILRFYVGLAPTEPLVQRLMQGSDDIFLNHLWTAGELLAATPPGQEQWRNALMSKLAQLFMREHWPTPLRNKALVALVESGTQGVGLLLQKAVNHPDPLIRLGAISGLGALGNEGDIGLIQAALDDEEINVRLAAVNALGRLSLLGNEQALELLIRVIVEGESKTQRTAAEILADMGKVGHDVLREGADDNDLMVRRAVIFGLVAVDQPWAKEIIERIQREDSEWVVRNAATEAIDSMGAGGDEEATLPELTLPQIEAEPWLITWAAERGEGTGMGEAALATLMRALTDEDPYIRHLAIETLGRLGDSRSVDALRRSLRDPEPVVRETALVALEKISSRYDLSISLKRDG